MRLNLDAGELPSEPPELWAQFDILNIACGGHTGDTASMTRVIEFCVAHSIAIGAHPSYPDREHFGRRSLSLDPAALHAALVGQLRALAGIATAHGARIEYVKPHGALYHDASRDPALASLLVDATRTALEHPVTIIGPRGHLQSAASSAGFAFAIEGFADRRMRADGSLVPRSEPNALITSPTLAAQQALALTDVDTVCVHADTPGSLEVARAVRAALGGSSKTSSLAPVSWVALGDRAIRFARPRSTSARALVDAIKRWPGVVDVVVARHDVAAYFVSRDAPRADLSDLELRIVELATLVDLDMPIREHELHAVYDGIDLDEVARTVGLTTDEVVRAHVGAEYQVDTLGFAPGFAYLVGLAPGLHLPRRPTPRARVPAGSLAIAGEYTAVYPFASPGGWHLIGRVDDTMFHTNDGARLQLGDRVRFAR